MRRDRILRIRISGDDWENVVEAYREFFGESERPTRQDIEDWAESCFLLECEVAGSGAVREQEYEEVD